MTETRVVRAVCGHDCPDQCSLRVTVADGRVLRVAGDPAHPFTDGWLCGKVQNYEERVHSPDRILTPLRRVGPKGEATFAPISWDEALTEIVARWRGVQRRYGGEALVGYAYSGHMGLINRNLPRALFHALGASQFQTGTVCDSAAEAGWTRAMGDTPGVDPETVVESDLVLCWGANLATTNVHMLPFVERARERGARLVVVDAARTRTARIADWHLMPRPGTDTALALGLMHVIVRDGLTDLDAVRATSIGLGRLIAEVLPAYDPLRVAAITGIEARQVERLADLYATAAAPFLRIGMGPSRHAGGATTIWSIALLASLVNSWGKPGGGAHMDSAKIWGWNYNALRRPDLLARATRTINHSLLGRALTEYDDPPVMALFVAANNPTVTCPESARVRAGLARGDLFTVVHDLFLTNTARYADIVLPATTALETDDLYRSYGTYYAQYADRSIDPICGARSNASLMSELADRFGIDDPLFSRSPREHLAALLADASGPTGALTVEELLTGDPIKLPWSVGVPLARFEAEDGLLPSWSEPPEDPRWPLQLLTGPGHFQAHTAYEGVDRLRRREGRPTCLLHPTDAEARGIRAGDEVTIANERGVVGLWAEIGDGVPVGTALVKTQRSRAAYRHGGPLNVLVGDDLTDFGAGATYQDTRVEVRRD